MNIDRLIKYQIPEAIIQSWKNTQGETLLPLQASAISQYNLLKGQSLIISSPTSSGKTFCGELAAVSQLFQQRKVVFLIPLKAIAEEKFSDFKEKYSSLGIKVVISTKDHQENDLDLEKGDFDLGIVIYEKFNQLLIKNLDLLKVVSLIVIDELQMISDPERGFVLELILAKILYSNYSPQILGLSAVLKDLEPLSGWMRCKLLIEKSRPVELYQGILLNGDFFYRKYNSKQEGKETLLEIESEEPLELLFANLEKLLKEGEQVLVFLKSKFDSENGALIFAERFEGEKAENSLKALSSLENTSLKEKLGITLEKGIAFHNADLSFEERNLVEKFYLEGEIRIIFATTTLAMGVNLPAKTVFLETQKYSFGEHSEKPILLPISWAEYENMSGRAGRFKLEKDFGRSIIIAANKFHFDALWQQYIEGTEEKLFPQLQTRDLEDIILDLVCSGLAKNIDDLKSILSQTLTGKLIWSDSVQFEKMEEKVNQLVADKFLILDQAKNLFSSPLGKICALQGIQAKTGKALKDKLEKETDFDLTSWLYNLLGTKDGEKIYVSLSRQEEYQKVYEEMLNSRCKQLLFLNEELKELATNPLRFTGREKQKVKMAFLFTDWIGFETTLDLEIRYSVRSGFLEQASQQLSWLLDSAHSISVAINSSEKMQSFLKQVSQKIFYGIPQEGLSIASLRLPGLGRDFVLRLGQEGFDSLEKIKNAEISVLEKIIPTALALNLKQEIEKNENLLIEKPVQQKIFNKPQEMISPKKQVELILDGTPVKNKFQIFLNNQKIILSAKSFSYLFKLAWARYEKEEGWIHIQDLEDGFNQAKYIYRLRHEIKRVFKGELIENNRLGGYHLLLPKEEIFFNFSALKKHPDAEIKKLAEEMEKKG